MVTRQPSLFEGSLGADNELPEGFDYVSDFLDPRDASELFSALREEVPWRQESVKSYGQTHALPRLTAWFGDPEAYYRYSGIGNAPMAWTPVLRSLRDRLKQSSKNEFNSVLLNLYRDGADSVSWHSDDEPELGRNPFIASLSLGETRRFRLRQKRSKESIGLDLTNGSLLTMSGESQIDWEHSLPKSKRELGERINLTFRYIRQP